MNNDIKEILEESIYCNYDLHTSEKKKLLDYITNLEEENEILRENAENNDKVVDKAKWNEMIYKSRNDKAMKYIKEHWIIDEPVKFKNDLLNILEGDDK